MRITVLLLTTLFLTATGQIAVAQDEKNFPKKSETNEIIIRRDGEQETKVTIQIDGDDIRVNGKPLSEYNDKDLKVLKRKMIISDGSPLVFDSDIFSDDMMEGTTIQSDSVAFLGVSTEKAEKGARIMSVTKESAAEKAGLMENDVITRINDQKVEDPESLSKAVTSYKPNEEIVVTYLRDGKLKKTKAVLQLKKQVVKKVTVTTNGIRRRNLNSPPPFEEDPMPGFNQGPPGRMPMGREFQPFPPKQKLGVKIQDTEDGNGVKIIEVADNSVAAMAGIQKDDVVTEVSGQKINNTDDIRELLRENEDLSKIQVKVLRNGKEMNFDIKPPKKLKTMVL